MSTVRVRRQNHSCEQCRRSRKACDGYLLNSLVVHEQALDTSLRPCSYCARTGKTCSHNPSWTEAHSIAKTQSALGTGLWPEDYSSAPPTKRRKTNDLFGTQSTNSIGSLDQLPDLSNATTQSTGNDGSLDDMLPAFGPSDANDASFWGDPALSINCSYSLSPNSSVDSACLDIFSNSYPGDVSLSQSFCAMQQTPYHEMWPGNNSIDRVTCSSAVSDQDTTALYESGSTMPTSDENLVCSSHPKQKSSESKETTEGREHRQGLVKRRPIAAQAQPFHVDFGLMAATSNTLITDSLLGIYHDVLENNLACWLSESTCPYQVQSSRQFKAGHDTTASQIGGATWSNQIYHRVVQLDRVARKTGQLQLSRDENRAASKALSLAIMAFATQWSQGKPRDPTPRYDGDESDLDDSALDEGDEFEHNIRESTWEQAKCALQTCSDLESYRVIYAELIFGLVQRPVARVGKIRSNPSAYRGSISQRKLDVTKLLASQNHSVIVERATRKAHTMKFRFEAVDVGFGNSATGEVPTGRLSSESKSTIGLLYWLAVMLDTVSSSISEKPVALADEDCQHEGLPRRSSTSGQSLHQSWEARLFIQDDLEAPSLSLNWPCDLQKAAEAVTRSAPVKVLLFRYVSYLQNSLRKRDFGKPIEDIIRGALLLYEYWNKTYASFFCGLIRDYEVVPPRIKSWFVCIVVPWHLGALMLADLIEFIDNNDMGVHQKSSLRIATSLHQEMREASANELADIANATTPSQDDLSSRQLPNMHFAVNQGSLLTEPWTILLVNAFSKAALHHLEALHKLEEHGTSKSGQMSESVQTAVQRLESCARCLRFLGRKTGVAEDIALVFLDAIRSHRSNRSA